MENYLIFFLLQMEEDYNFFLLYLEFVFVKGKFIYICLKTSRQTHFLSKDGLASSSLTWAWHSPNEAC